ncbi:MAG: SDR family NAD(P)-dependent oxidoreductase [Planctomycetaceae bacterium]|jgi:acyl transferase domain-containing protein/NAD(P)-dependent dehydrogenase (short-subunit alcohol dehydrogenase family)|nr:SDR family NAD(P)-dependent oxidoreductase [Planctomycetaceae bacterium]
MDNFSDLTHLPDGNLSLAIVGISCRLPGADNIESYWDLILKGSYAINEVPKERFNREIYFDKTKGVKGKSYISHAGLVNYSSFDPLSFPFPSRLVNICDTGTFEMCRVAAEALRDAGINPFQIPYRNTGVYLGSTSVGRLGNEITYSTFAPKIAQILFDLKSTQKNLSEEQLCNIVSEIVVNIRQNSVCQNQNANYTPKVQSMSVAVSESFGFTGVSLTLDAACSSSLNALAMARRDLRAGLVDMAIVGGGNYFTQESMILFSNAQSGSPDGSFPFTDLSNGVIVSEGYVALVVKTLERALSDGDKIHAIVHGIGLSSDGRGRSHWAPRIEGEIAAIKNAYKNPSDLQRLAYYEAHATSTQLGDKTELDAIQSVFANALKDRIPIGSVKGNIGHPLEAAGVAGLIKTILILKHNIIPPQVCPKPLNKNVDWDALRFYVPDCAAELPPSRDGLPRLAGVSAFGVGGINAHVVIQEPPNLNKQNYRYKNSDLRKEIFATSIQKISREPIAVIGVGSLFAGSLNFEAFKSLVESGVGALSSVSSDRWSDVDVCIDRDFRTKNTDSDKSQIRRGGFVTGFKYDWKRHKIPPKQIESGNPLQFMILDVVDRAFESAGISATKNTLNTERTGVIVGSNFYNDFITDLTISYKLVPFRRLAIETLKSHGISDSKIISEFELEFTDKFFERFRSLLDEAGGFTASSLASRITKVYDLSGGCVTVDAGSASGLAAISQSVEMLRENENDLVICAAGSSNMSPLAFICYEKYCGGFADTDKVAPGEGAAVLLMKRLSDVKRNNAVNNIGNNVGDKDSNNVNNNNGENNIDGGDEKILFLIHGVGVGFDADISVAYSKAVRQAWDSSGLSKEILLRINHVELGSNELRCGGELLQKTQAVMKSFYPDAEFANIAGQIGDAQAASGIASALNGFIVTNNRMLNNGGSSGAFYAISASDDSGIAYHILIECVGDKLEKDVENKVDEIENKIVEIENKKVVEIESKIGEAAAGLSDKIIVTKKEVEEVKVSGIDVEVGKCCDESGKIFEGGTYRMVRFAADSIDVLRSNLENRSTCVCFGVNDIYRMIFITDSESNLSEQISYALNHLSDNHAEKFLSRKNIIFGKRQIDSGKIAFLFSGQGSQYEGMLKSFASCSQVMDLIVGNLDGELRNAGLPSFAELAWSGKAELGVDVLWTQISMFAADLILFNLAKKAGITPNIVTGHSYGEYPAITAAGGWSIKRGISATKIRCDAIMNSNGIHLSDNGEGGVGGCLLAAQMNEEAANNFCNEMLDDGMIIFIANLNSPKQSVFGASAKDIRTAYSILRERKIPSVILSVPRPFHTPFMDPIREPLNLALDEVATGNFALQFFSGVSNRLETSWTRIRKNLANQLVRSVRFVAVVEELLNSGCTALIECGPGNVLTGLNQKIIAEYLEKNPNAIKPICASLDVKETDRTKSDAGEIQLLTVRGMLEIAGHFDGEQKIITDAANAGFTKTETNITPEKIDADIIVTEKIRQKLRSQADNFDPATAIKISPDEPIPQFIIDLAAKAAVCPEPLFAYWKSHPDDKEIFETIIPVAENHKIIQSGSASCCNKNISELSQEEYLQILKSNRNEPAENASNNSTRFVPRLVTVPLVKTERLILPVFGRVLIIGDSPLGIALERLLSSNGVDAVTVRSSGNIDELIAKVDGICQSAPAPHCFVVPSREEWNSYHAEKTEPSIGQWNDVDWKRNRNRRVLNPFAAVQCWYKSLAVNKELFAKGSIFVVTFLGGNSGYAINVTENESNITNNICGGTLAGLAKTLFVEAGLTTQFKFRSVNIDLSTNISSKQGAEIILDEWACGGINDEVAYSGTKRRLVMNVPDYLSYKNNSPFPKTTYTNIETQNDAILTAENKPQGAWIITGGARGITAFTARNLAKEFGIKLNLIGSSPLPSVPDEWIGLDNEAKKALQKNIMIKAKQDGLNPISEWNKIEREIDLVESLKQFDDEGVVYDYYACDVTDSAKLELTLEAIRRKYGKISGVLHGAGLDFSAAFQKKDIKRVERTLAVKVDAAAAIMNLLHDEPLKHFIAFGSCSGRIGSVGQTDYATANESLAKLVAVYAQLKPNCKCICFAWGPWDEIGMAVKIGVKDSIALKGYIKIPPKYAYKFIKEELGLNAPDNEIMICDWKMLTPRFDKIINDLDKIIIETKNQSDENEITTQNKNTQTQNIISANQSVDKFANNAKILDNKINVTINPNQNLTENQKQDSIDPSTDKPQQQTAISTSTSTQTEQAFISPNRNNRTMKRMIVRMEPRPNENILDDKNSNKTQFKFNNRALIYGDNPDAWVLAEKLLQYGVTSTILPEIEDEKVAIEKLRGFSESDFPLHLFIMSSRNPLALFDPLKSSDLVEHWQRRRLVGFDVPAMLLGEWLKIVAKSGKLADSSVAAAVSLGGDFAIGNAIESQSGIMGIEGGLITGLLKGLYVEHGGEKRDKLTVRIIDATINESPIMIAETIIAELANGTLGDKFGIESAIINGKIMTPRLVDAELENEKNQQQKNKITEGGTWIVTGGARGITAECVKTLAEKYKLKIHILGKQPLPQIDENLRYLDDEQLKPYKIQITTEALKNRILPSKVWDEFQKKIEIDRNLRKMKQLGIEVTYHQCDVTDNAQLEKTIDEIHKTNGKISGLIHGACMISSFKNILKRNPKDFCNDKLIIDAKFDAAISLLQLLKDDPLEATIWFSSISGRFGANRDSIYCAANDALSKLPKFYHRIKPRAHSFAVHWHGWDKVGMMMLTLNYGARVIQKMNLLSPQEGTERLLEELESGSECEVIISDDEYYRNIYSSSLKLNLTRLKLPLADKITADQMETTWDPVSEVLISDHRLADKPILPAALMIESIIEAALTFAQKYDGDGIIDTKNPVLLRNFDIAEGLRFFADAPVTMRTMVNNLSDEKNQFKISCRLLTTFANSKGVILNPNRFHAGADVLIYPNYEALPEIWKKNINELLTKYSQIPNEKFNPQKIQYVPRGSKMYHGPTLQELQTIAINESEIIGETITQNIENIAGNRTTKNWITHPASIDACLYLCGAATWHRTKGVGLPKSIDEILFIRKPKNNEKTKILVKQIEQNNNVIKYNFIQIDENNKPICICNKYNCRLLM